MNDITSSTPLSPLPPEEPLSMARSEFVPPMPRAQRRLRLWPGVVIVVLQWLLIEVPRWVAPGTMTQFMAMFWGPIIMALLLMLWWLFASRIRWTDRFLVLFGCAATAALAYPFYHSSFTMIGIIIFALPIVTTAWVLWLLITPSLSWPMRRMGLLVLFLLTWGYFGLIRYEGSDGSLTSALAYRWTLSAEEKFLAEKAAVPSVSPPAHDPADVPPLVLQPGDWPGFRGADRDGRRTGTRLVIDWQQAPPRLVWRHRIGPGWSSFAVVGTRLFTQEQRGADEVVACYDANSGAEIWAHGDAARFTEAVAGPGPRATPTFHEGRIYAVGAAGRLNCLDAATGRMLWSRDLVADSEAKVPQWGFAASPLVLQNVVTVFAGGPEGKSVLGYHASTGELAWAAGEGQHSYCSPHPARLGGVEQLVVATDVGLLALHPARGEILWQHRWPLKEGMPRVIQPTLLGDSDLLLGTSFDFGTRRVHVSRKGADWETQEVWTSRALKPYFNDMVVHQGYLYGFDSNFLTCVSLDDGKGKWRARGYGNGQVLLLPDQGLLLVLSEKGEVALVEATAAEHKELGRFQAIEGKTWNHPVLAQGRLFVRNGEEAACYQLAETSTGVIARKER